MNKVKKMDIKLIDLALKYVMPSCLERICRLLVCLRNEWYICTIFHNVCCCEPPRCATCGASNVTNGATWTPTESVPSMVCRVSMPALWPPRRHQVKCSHYLKSETPSPAVSLFIKIIKCYFDISVNTQQPFYIQIVCCYWIKTVIHSSIQAFAYKHMSTL